jgi:hypothetical protein
VAGQAGPRGAEQLHGWQWGVSGGGLHAPTWDAHDSDHEEGGDARQDVEYGQPGVGRGRAQEEETHEVHEGDDGPAIQH